MVIQDFFATRKKAAVPMGTAACRMLKRFAKRRNRYQEVRSVTERFTL